MNDIMRIFNIFNKCIFYIIIFIFYCSFLLISCNSFYDYPIELHEIEQNNVKIKKIDFINYNNMGKFNYLKLNSTLDLYPVGGYYYSFFSERILQKNDKYVLKYANDNFLYEYTLVIFDTVEKNIIIHDSIHFKSFRDVMTETEHYYYFKMTLQGYPYIFRTPYDNYVEGLLLINKDFPPNFKIFEFPEQRILIVEEREKRLRVVTTELETTFPIINWLVNQMSPHQWIGEWVSTGIFFEIIIGLDMKISDRIEIEESEIGYRKND